jgi:hypothetical protein
MLHVGAERSGLLTYTDFPYIGMMLGLVPAGDYATWVGTARAAFDFGAVTLLACPVILWVFKQVADSAIALPQLAPWTLRRAFDVQVRRWHTH